MLTSLCMFQDILPVLCAVIASLCGLLLIRSIRSYLCHPLLRFPGPFIAAWSNLPYSYWALRGRQPFKMHELHEKYGSVVRVAPNELSFSSSTSWDDIYGIRPGHETFRKGNFYSGGSFHEVASSIVTVRDPIEHRVIRRQLSPALSEKALRGQEHLIQEIVDRFIEKIRDHAQRGPVDLTRWLDMALFDITGSLVCGRTFDAISNGGNHPSVAFILEALQQMTLIDKMRRFPVLGVIVRSIFPRKVAALLHGNKIHEANTLAIVVDRRENPSGRPDFLTRIMEDNQGALLTDVQLAAHTADLFQAGAHSSNTTICAAMYWLLKDPPLFENLKKEVRNLFPTTEQVNGLSVQRMKLAKAVILETWRMYPAVPLGLPRVVPEGGDTIDGYLLPQGTIVSTNPLAANLSSKNFSDPMKFKPSRWMENSGSDTLKASQPFLLGTRACMGQKLAWVEILTILSKLLICFEIELSNPDLDWHRDSRMNVLWKKPALLVNLRPVQCA